MEIQNGEIRRKIEIEDVARPKRVECAGLSRARGAETTGEGCGKIGLR